MLLKMIPEAVVVKMNKAICEASREPVGQIGTGKVASALHSAYYPGTPPYQHGGATGIAGAMAFYLAKAHAFANGNKRTASAAALAFLRVNGYAVVYPGDTLAEVIVGATVGTLSMEELKWWFDAHKVAAV